MRQRRRNLLLERLLVPKDGQPPRIGQYAGKGPLVAWLRMVVSRAEVDAQRAGRQHDDLDRHDLPAGRSADPELAMMRERFSGSLRC